MRRNLVQISNAAFTVIALSISVLLHAASSSIMDSMDEICVSEVDCYPKLFSPTHGTYRMHYCFRPNMQSPSYISISSNQLEFKVIRPGQILPPGLHVRVDMQTMEKSAKINVVGEGEENGSIILSTTEDGKVIQQEESTAMGGGGGAVIHGKDPVSSSNSDKMYSNYRTSKLPLQERDAFGKLIEKMLEKSENEIMEILEKLEEVKTLQGACVLEWYEISPPPPPPSFFRLYTKSIGAWNSSLLLKGFPQSPNCLATTRPVFVQRLH